jgi:hypothetical protein
MARIAPIEAAWNIGTWAEVDVVLLDPDGHADVVQRQHQRRCVSSTPFGSPVVPPVYMSRAGVVLLRLGRRELLTGGDRGPRSGGRAAVPSPMSTTVCTPAASRLESMTPANHTSTKTTLVGESDSTWLSSRGAKRRFERVDDARPEQARVVQLLEHAAVQRHDGDAVTGLDSRAPCAGAGQAQDPRPVLAVGGGAAGAGVGEERRRRVPVDRGQQLPVPDELLHGYLRIRGRV